MDFVTHSTLQGTLEYERSLGIVLTKGRINRFPNPSSYIELLAPFSAGVHSLLFQIIGTPRLCVGVRKLGIVEAESRCIDLVSCREMHGCKFRDSCKAAVLQ